MSRKMVSSTTEGTSPPTLIYRTMEETLSGVDIGEFVGNVEVSDANIAKYTKVALLSMRGFTNGQIASEIGVHIRVVMELKKADEYLAVLNSINEEIIKTARMFLSSASLKATKTLVDCLDSKYDKIRIQAATEILNRVGVKTPDQIEFVNKANNIDTMTPDELEDLINLGLEEIMNKKTEKLGK
jgi:hypothetical protein